MSAVPNFPAWKWRYIERLLAANGQPVARKLVRELRDRAVYHETALREIAVMGYEADPQAPKVAREALNGL